MSESDGLEIAVTSFKVVTVRGEDIGEVFCVRMEEWPNGEGADISINTRLNGESTWVKRLEYEMPFTHFEALVKAYNEIVGIPTQSKKEGRVLEI